MSIQPKLQSVKKFYFLEYFYVLLKSIQNYEDKELIFNEFKVLKEKHNLGESKYKKLSFDEKVLSKTQMDRYHYTFTEVLTEANEYKLISQSPDSSTISLTVKGRKLIETYEKQGLDQFNNKLFTLMEEKYFAFFDLIQFFYKANPKKGLLIFPIYSPLKLGIQKKDIKNVSDMINYTEKLVNQIFKDMRDHIESNKEALIEENKRLIKKLVKEELLSNSPDDLLNPELFNKTIKRIRDYWLNYFLKNLYNYKYSFNSFSIWIYRGKQIGIIHASEFYPNFNGLVVYPTSVITNSSEKSKDFKQLFKYNSHQALFVHEPSWSTVSDKFVEALTDSYFTIKKMNRNVSFVNLTSVRELVCYKMKISQRLFDQFLGEAYTLNLKGKLTLKISLEADKLPQETNAMYLKREPVMINGKYRNIIAIDLTTE